MRVSKEAVIRTASDLADEKSCPQGISLKTVAERLGIRTPSLYNHIESLDDLLLAVAHNGMRAMNSRMSKVAIAKTGDNAIKAVGIEYLNYVIEHPGVYQTIEWATWNGSSETTEILDEYTGLLITLIHSCDLKSPNTDEILRLLTGVLHGYTTQQFKYAAEQPEEARENLCMALDTVLAGIQQRYG